MYCLIMAGGSGTRFWPKSREHRSKQFLKIFEKKSLIQSTVSRFTPFLDTNQIYIVAREDQSEEIRKHVPEIPVDNLIYEPMGKNTAPCIGLAAMFIHKHDPDGVVIVSPADHLIQKNSVFRKAIKTAAKVAEDTGGLVTIGIPPTRPSTGYGYIQINGEVEKYSVKTYAVKTFAEKPNLATAERFLKSGDFFWNSGIFIFKVSSFLNALEIHLPDLFDALKEVGGFIGEPNFSKVLHKVYRQIRSISIDYGVMEKADNVYLVKGEFTWSDLGSWEQVYKLSPKDAQGNAVFGNAVIVDSKNSYIHSSEGLIGLIGLDNVVVVQEEGVTLVCKRENAESVKLLVDQLKRKNYQEYL